MKINVKIYNMNEDVYLSFCEWAKGKVQTYVSEFDPDEEVELELGSDFRAKRKIYAAEYNKKYGLKKDEVNKNED